MGVGGDPWHWHQHDLRIGIPSSSSAPILPVPVCSALSRAPLPEVHENVIAFSEIPGIGCLLIIVVAAQPGK